MFVKGFSEILIADLPSVGGKGANLGEMTKEGLPVPPGFCITAKAYQYFINRTGIIQMIERLENLSQINNLAEVEPISKQMTEVILRTEIPKDLRDLIIEAFDRYITQDCYVAVRSSATSEDLPEASFAGQQESFLYVRRNNLLTYIKRCWASLWIERAIHYRKNNGFDHRKVYLAIVIQEMISSDISGVAFSINPINQSDTEIVIESVWGLGEGIVSGQLSPDRFVVDKINEVILEKGLAEKNHMVVQNITGDGTNLVPTSEQQRTLYTLSDQLVLELLHLVKQIEKHYHSPQDIEWAFANNQFYILQSRPITTLKKIPALIETEPELFNFDPELEWTNLGGVKERYHKPLSTLGWSILEPCQNEGGLFSLKTNKKKALDSGKFVTNIYGYLYINFSSLKESLPLSLLKPYLDEDKTGEFKPERSKIKDLYLTFNSYTAGTKMIRTLDKVFYNTLPNYLAELNRLSLFNLETLNEIELVDYIQQNLKLAKSYFKYQTSSLAVAEGLYNMLIGFLTKSLKADLALCSKLVSGFNNNLTVETNNDVWQLSKLVRESKELRALLENFPSSVFLQKAAVISDGKSFLVKLDELLTKRGHLNINMDIANDFWWENPDIVLSMVKGFLTEDENFDPAQREILKQKERTKTECLVRSRLNPMQRIFFIKLLGITQTYMLLRDNRHYYVTMPFSFMKKSIRQLAARLNEKDYIKDERYIYHLTFDEIKQLIQGTLSKETANNLIIRRKGAKPISLDELPSFIKGWPKLMRLQVHANQNNSMELKGMGSSPGIANGPVKIVRTPTDFSSFRAGDILVAVSTDPAWTPLFAIAKAVITEYGGMLSHGAIVAREYDIPAVLNVKNATSLLKDGQKVTVDGNKGLILIH